VKLIFVRDGSAILYSEFGMRPIKVGDVVVLAPSALCGSEPEGRVTVTTLYLDRDFVTDQVFWQYAALFSDRFEAQQVVETWFAEPAQVLHLGEDRAGYLMPWLDELVALSLDGPPPERFYRTQSLLYAIVDVVGPMVNVDEARIPGHRRASVRPTPPRRRYFAPVRQEARDAAEVLRASVQRQWSLEQLAEQVHLSSSQLGRVFVEAFGKTPIAYLTMLRAERMAYLLGTTDDQIATVAREVVWSDPDYAGRLFRRSVGLTPRQYRQLSRRVPTAGRTGRFPR
jgi:AraC family transcriptional regulator